MLIYIYAFTKIVMPDNILKKGAKWKALENLKIG